MTEYAGKHDVFSGYNTLHDELYFFIISKTIV